MKHREEDFSESSQNMPVQTRAANLPPKKDSFSLSLSLSLSQVSSNFHFVMDSALF
jgi:hypothetical protein